MESHTRAALELLGKATGGFFDPYRVAGSHNSSVRQNIVSTYTGGKVPKAKCGVNAIEAWMFDALKPEGNCLAAKRDDCIAKLRALGIQTHPNA